MGWPLAAVLIVACIAAALVGMSYLSTKLPKR